MNGPDFVTEKNLVPVSKIYFFWPRPPCLQHSCCILARPPPSYPISGDCSPATLLSMAANCRTHACMPSAGCRRLPLIKTTAAATYMVDWRRPTPPWTLSYVFDSSTSTPPQKRTRSLQLSLTLSYPCVSVRCRSPFLADGEGG